MESLIHHYFNIAQCDKAVGFSTKEITGSVLNILVLITFRHTSARLLYLKCYIEDIFYWVKLLSIKQKVIANTVYLHTQKKWRQGEAINLLYTKNHKTLYIHKRQEQVWIFLIA